MWNFQISLFPFYSWCNQSLELFKLTMNRPKHFEEQLVVNQHEFFNQAMKFSLKFTPGKHFTNAKLFSFLRHTLQRHRGEQTSRCIFRECVELYVRKFPLFGRKNFAHGIRP